MDRCNVLQQGAWNWKMCKHVKTLWLTFLDMLWTTSRVEKKDDQAAKSQQASCLAKSRVEILQGLNYWQRIPFKFAPMWNCPWRFRLIQTWNMVLSSRTQNPYNHYTHIYFLDSEVLYTETWQTQNCVSGTIPITGILLQPCAARANLAQIFMRIPLTFIGLHSDWRFVPIDETPTGLNDWFQDPSTQKSRLPNRIGNVIILGCHLVHSEQCVIKCRNWGTNTEQRFHDILVKVFGLLELCHCLVA